MSPDYALLTGTDLDSIRMMVEKAKKFSNISSVESVTDYIPAEKDQKERIKIIKNIRKNLIKNKKISRINNRTFNSILAQLDTLWMNIFEMSSLAFQAGQDRLEEKCYELVKNPDNPNSDDFIKSLILFFKSNPVRSIKGLNKFQKDYFPYLRKSAIQMANPEFISVDNLPSKILDRFISKDKKHFLVSIFPKKGVWNIKNLNSFTRQIKSINQRATGTPPMFLALINYIGKDGKRASILALIAVLLLLLIDFKNIWFALLGMIPLVAGAVWMAGIASLSGIMLNVVNVIAIPLIIGIGIDDGVHIIHRYRIEGYKNIKTVFTSTGKAIMLTSLTTIIAFGSLIFISYRGLVSMGLLLVIGIASCFFTTVLFLSPIFRIIKHDPGE